jgi:hypothetical protein
MINYWSLDIRLYDGDWNQIDSCINCSELSNIQFIRTDDYYAVVETRISGCIDTAASYLTEPEELVIQDTSVSMYFGLYNVSCSYSSDGGYR